MQENFFKAIFESTTDGILLINPQTKKFYIGNKAICEMLGCSIEEISKMEMTDIHPKESMSYVEEQLGRQAKGEIVVAKNIPVKRKDGSVFYADISASPVTLNGTVYLSGVFRDVTDRKLAEEKILLLSKRQESILAAVPDIIMEVDENKVYAWADPAGLDFFGDDVVGKEANFYFEGEQETYEKVAPLFKGSEDTFYVESWQRRKDGEKRLLAWWCHALKDKSGKVTGALSTARDITDYKKTEEALRKSEEMFSTLAQSSPDCIKLFDVKGSLLFINNGGLKEHGFKDVEEAKKSGIFGTIVLQDQGKFKNAFSLAIGGKETSVEVCHTKNGSNRGCCLETVTPIFDDNKKAVKILAVSRDITEMKKSTEELKNKNEELKKMNKLMIDRELKMVEMKEEMEKLKNSGGGCR